MRASICASRPAVSDVSGIRYSPEFDTAQWSAIVAHRQSRETYFFMAWRSEFTCRGLGLPTSAAGYHLLALSADFDTDARRNTLRYCALRAVAIARRQDACKRMCAL